MDREHVERRGVTPHDPLSAEADDQVMVDDDGYPTGWGIAQLRGFTGGTPEQFVEMVRQLWWLPELIETAHSTDRDGRPIVRIRLVTGGWSGNEEVIQEIDATFFAVFYWASSHRGGLHVFEVPETAWQADALI
jgi:hypothetical protein